jgi:hypothetical protein
LAFAFIGSLWLLWNNQDEKLIEDSLEYSKGSLEYSDLRTNSKIEKPNHKEFHISSKTRIYNKKDEEYDSYLDMEYHIVVRQQKNTFFFFPESFLAAGTYRTAIHTHSDLKITKDSSNQFLYWINIDYVFCENAVIYGEKKLHFYMKVRNGVKGLLKSPTIDTLHIPMISADTIIGDYKTIRKTYLFKQEKNLMIISDISEGKGFQDLTSDYFFESKDIMIEEGGSILDTIVLYPLSEYGEFE